MSILQKYKYPIIAVAAILTLLGIVAAASIITAPEHITGTPEATPTPVPTATPSPTPVPTPTTVLHLTSNNTTPFYIGDTLHLIAQLTPAQAGITVTLYNNGALAPVPNTAVTNAAGTATFDRLPTLPFDYTITASIP